MISTAKAKGIEKEWTQNLGTTTWEFIDYFDLTGKYYNYPEHKRGFKEMDDYYLVVLKSSDTIDEILKISKEGSLIKKINFNNYTYQSANYVITDNNIIVAREVYENSKYILRLEKYDFDFNIILKKDYEISKNTNQREYVKIHNNSIYLITLSNENVYTIKYDYNFNKISEEVKLDIKGTKSVFRETESEVPFIISGKIYIYDVIKEKVEESPYTNQEEAAEKHRADEYNFYGDGITIGNNFYYKLENGKYKAYNLNNKLIMENDSFYFYDLHGRLVASKNGQTNNLFSVYDLDGNYEMDIDMFIITSDGFLTLKRISSNNTEISRYKIKYNTKVITPTDGQVSIEKETYDVNEIVKVNVTPKEGYVLGKIKVTDTYNQEIEVNSDNTFKMPGSDVTIEVTFVTEPAEPEPKPEGNPNTGQKLNLTILILIIVVSVTIILSKKTKFKKV